MGEKQWELEDLENKLQKQEETLLEKTMLKYEDNYMTEHKTYLAFPAIASFLAVNLDYTETKSLSKLDSVESLKQKLKSEYDISLQASLSQRISHVSCQHPNTQ